MFTGCHRRHGACAIETNNLARNSPAPARIPAGPVAFTLALSLYKAGALKASMGANWSDFLTLWTLDLPYIAALALLAISCAYIHRSWLHHVLPGGLALLCGFYLVDTAVVLALDAHANLFDLLRYGVEWRVALTFVDFRLALAGLLFLLSFTWRARPTPVLVRSAFLLLPLLLLLGALCQHFAPPELSRYAVFDPTRLYRPVPAIEEKRYNDSEIAFYAHLRQGDIFIPPDHPNIILLIVESLSAINSQRVSGVGNLLGEFDDMSTEGLLFSNFFANHQASEGGIISLLSGFSPMHFPGATPYMFDEFGAMPSVLAQYHRAGYHTEFLTNAELQFIGLDRYLHSLGVDRSRGRDEVGAMRTAPRVVQDAPADNLLYAEALRTINTLSQSQQPYLLVLATTSTHLPYTHPAGGPNTAAAVWHWAQQQLAGFYGQLKESDYFAHGILLITGDHRQMRPLTRRELLRYGDSAKARIPLLAIGAGYTPGSIDRRFFQQADLLRELGKIPDGDISLSPHPIWVERYNRKYGHIELIHDLGLFDEADQGRHEFRVKALGSQLIWQGEKPGFARSATRRIHAQRSRHQQLKPAD